MNKVNNISELLLLSLGDQLKAEFTQLVLSVSSLNFPLIHHIPIFLPSVKPGTKQLLFPKLSTEKMHSTFQPAFHVFLDYFLKLPLTSFLKLLLLLLFLKISNTDEIKLI